MLSPHTVSMLSPPKAAGSLGVASAAVGGAAPVARELRLLRRAAGTAAVTRLRRACRWSRRSRWSRRARRGQAGQDTTRAGRLRRSWRLIGEHGGGHGRRGCGCVGSSGTVGERLRRNRFTKPAPRLDQAVVAQVKVIVPSLPIRVDQAVMLTSRRRPHHEGAGRARPPLSGGFLIYSPRCCPRDRDRA